MNPVGLGRRRPVDLDGAVADQVGRPAAGDPEQPAQRDVDPLALQAVGHGQGAVVRHGSAGWGGAPSSRRAE